MTTTVSAHNVTEALRADLARNIDQFTRRMADHAVSTRHTNLRVLYADCGMVVMEENGKFRLTGPADLTSWREFNAADAQRAADRWNEQLTREQMVSRCWVNVLTIPQALERAADEAQAILDLLAKPAA